MNDWYSPDFDKVEMARFLKELDDRHSVSLPEKLLGIVNRTLSTYAAQRADIERRNAAVAARQSEESRIAERSTELFAAYPKHDQKAKYARCGEQVFMASGQVRGWGSLRRCQLTPSRVVGEDALCGPHAKQAATKAAQKEIRGW